MMGMGAACYHQVVVLMVHTARHDTDEPQNLQIGEIRGWKLDRHGRPTSISATVNCQPPTLFIVAAWASAMRRMASLSGGAPIFMNIIPPSHEISFDLRRKHDGRRGRSGSSCRAIW